MTLHIKKIVRENFHGFTFFYRYLGWRVFALFAMSLMVGLFDGLSLALFMPLLELIGTGERTALGSTDQLGSLSFLTNAFEFIGIPLRASFILLAIFTLLSLKALFNFLGAYIGAIFQQQLIRKIRVENVEKVRKLKYEIFVTTDAGKIQNSLSTEVDRVNGSFKQYITVLQLAVQILVYTFLAFLANPQFALLVIFGSVISNRIFNLVYNATKRASKNISELGHRFHGLLIQFVTHFKYLKSTGLSTAYGRKLEKEIKYLEIENRRLGFLNGIIMGIREPLAIGVVIFIILIDLTFLGGSLSAIVLSVLFLYRALTQVMSLQTSYNGYLSTAGSLENLIELQAYLDKHAEITNGIEQNRLSSFIELKDVSFAYGTELILSNIDLQLFRNQTYALVGVSGSGKTTLMNILSGLLTPTKGSMLIDGKNLDSLDRAFYRSKIGYITQEPVVFDDTVFNNVTFWSDNTNENIQKCHLALEKAALKDFISSQPNGLEARLGNNGINLSGGQKQRISIARELFKDLDLLLLDEATSALDSETEGIIKENIESMKGNVTIVMIAHRLSTVKHADQIIIMDKGCTKANGTYEELLASSSSFKSMIQKQEILN